jgi:tryptophan synthase beta chain
MTADLGGRKDFLKRKISPHGATCSTMCGPGALAKKMGKTRVIAENRSGPDGVATATAAPCWTWMRDLYGRGDTERQP